jgi:hypothetical protein
MGLLSFGARQIAKAKFRGLDSSTKKRLKKFIDYRNDKVDYYKKINKKGHQIYSIIRFGAEANRQKKQIKRFNRAFKIALKKSKPLHKEPMCNGLFTLVKEWQLHLERLEGALLSQHLLANSMNKHNITIHDLEAAIQDELDCYEFFRDNFDKPFAEIKKVKQQLKPIVAIEITRDFLIHITQLMVGFGILQHLSLIQLRKDHLFEESEASLKALHEKISQKLKHRRLTPNAILNSNKIDRYLTWQKLFI